ncbi:fibrillin protein 5 homolog isoform X1 [Cryptomeria japonica]|uniref:fibrillin protein 5 homolog isoform X1 n=1 Tax=Cryptomeria japonica TaxID=3369 RepID=UPI0027DA3FC0|nr:fibrillin protein 5 homolog isoform X1 [Cryptomeria japonica]
MLFIILHSNGTLLAFGYLQDAKAKKKQHILGLIEALEACNPTTNPIDSPFLSGFWSLLYTAPTDEEKVDKYAGTEEGPFLARLKPLSLGTVRQTASFQVIDLQGESVQNIADFVLFGIKGRLVIKGRAVKSSTPGKESRRIDVTFESFYVSIGNWQSPVIPLDWVNPKGWVDNTFLDQDLRVGRGDKGSVFVSARVKE